jgi:hypothetical protein
MSEIDAKESLYYVIDPQRFGATVLFREGRAVIPSHLRISFMSGWTLRAVRGFCLRSGWKLTELKEEVIHAVG